MMRIRVTICFVLLFFLNGRPVLSQVASSDTIPKIASAEIKWLHQFPSGEKSKVRTKKTFGDLLSLLTGEKTGSDAALSKPVGVCVITPSEFLILDQGNANMVRVKQDRAEIIKAFSRHKGAYSSLVGVCYRPDFGIFFTDSRTNTIFSLRSEKKAVPFITDSTRLNQPTGIAWNALRSELWVVETAAHCITLFDATGRKIKSFGGRGAGKGQFNFPTSIWIDSSGLVYVVDALNYRVQVFNGEGNYVHGFGGVGNSTGYFASPKGIATDSYGDVYVVDALFHVVQIFDRQGQYLYSFGSQGREAGQFWMPTGIFIDSDDHIYVADSYNSRIQIFALTNIVMRNETNRD